MRRIRQLESCEQFLSSKGEIYRLAKRYRIANGGVEGKREGGKDQLSEIGKGFRWPWRQTYPRVSGNIDKMFTGLVQALGIVLAVTDIEAGKRLTVSLAELVEAEIRPGDSVCVSGVCLTVVKVANGNVQFDVITETLRRTTLGRKGAQDRVNLELSLRPTDFIGGHFVQGHVDAAGAGGEGAGGCERLAEYFCGASGVGGLICAEGFGGGGGGIDDNLGGGGEYFYAGGDTDDAGEDDVERVEGGG